jgi:cytochrome c-type biogenesis protein CcmE
MKPAWKLALGASVIVAVTAYMAYVGASASWKYYLTADEYVADAERFGGQRVRISGAVAPGTLKISPQGNQVAFRLQGETGQLEVVCFCPIPDNLEEGMEVVVEGRCEPGEGIRGDKLLTRCASKYEANDDAKPASSSGIRTADSTQTEKR